MSEIVSEPIFVPEIDMKFSKDILSRPTPKLREDSDTLWKSWLYIESLWKKLDNQPVKRAKCEELKKQFMELYERAKAKEKERETEKTHPTQIPFYFIGSIGEKDEEAFRCTKYRWHIPTIQASRRYGKIYKVQTTGSRLKEYGRYIRIEN